MGKNIISQARGHGSLTYRVRRRAFIYKIKYPYAEGEGKLLKLIHSAGHSAPLAKIMVGNTIFYNAAASGMYEGQKVFIGAGAGVIAGNILKMKDIPTKTQIYNLESRPNDGGKFIKTAGGYAIVTKKEENSVWVMMPSKKEKVFNGDCRASIGFVAGGGRKEKPVMKAGTMYFIKHAKSKLWPRTSAVKVNAIDHPFGSGRGKNLTHGKYGKIPRRDAPPGKNVGSIRARRTGKRA
jgi:large subunit ribosomal protein L2